MGMVYSSTECAGWCGLDVCRLSQKKPNQAMRLEKCGYWLYEIFLTHLTILYFAKNLQYMDAQ